MVASEGESEEVVGAALFGAEHAGCASDWRKIKVLGLAGTHPDLISQGVVDHSVAVLALFPGDDQDIVEQEEVDLLP